MKQFLRLGDGYALTKHKSRDFNIRYISLMAAALFMCLTARGQDASRVLPITGTVVDTAGQPIQGATVSIIGTSGQTQTDEYGRFTIRSTVGEGTLRVRFVGYQSLEVPFEGTTAEPIWIALTPMENLIEEVEINAGYYTVNDRERTSSITRVDGQTFSEQPVDNLLAALHGRVPGLEVTQQTGVPGGNTILRIRGQNSLLNGSDPLFVIDGVPLLNGQQPINRLSNASNETSDSRYTAGISIFSLISPADIASVEVLKDADATAIYGSRGANGVILITTKKADSNQLAINVGFRTGLSEPARSIKMLTGPEYMAMRREALSNDGLTASDANAPDLVLWDTTRYNDYGKLLQSHRAQYDDLNVSVRGRGRLSDYLISGNYHSQSTVFYDDVATRRLGLQFSGGIADSKNRFRSRSSLGISWSNSKLPTRDLTRYLNSSPYLKLFNEDGSLAWENGGIPYRNIGIINANPLAYLKQTYNAAFLNLIGSTSIEYDITKGFDFKMSVGYNLTTQDEHSSNPNVSLDDFSTVMPSANFSNGRASSWIAEPQFSYQRNTGWGVLSALLGGTWQSDRRESMSVSGTNYNSDLLLRSVAAAGNTHTTNSTVQYRYQGLYARINANFKGRYIMNLTARRDGSSRFSPENRFASFGAFGLAWLLSEERFMQGVSFLDLAKLRASYGVTGNDQIGDYGYIDIWSPNSYTYAGRPTISPRALYNPDFSWERNKKLELGLETQFLSNKIGAHINFYRNISDNQLIQYALPIQVGFESVIRNLPATILNSGIELNLDAELFSSRNWTWSSSLNMTFPTNKLLSFPEHATSSYRTQFVIGHSLNTNLRYHYLGVDPQTGMYAYEDVDGNGMYNVEDAIFPASRDVRLFGGFMNTVRYKQFDITIMVDFKRQDGYNYLHGLGSNIPGYPYANQPALVLRRWRHPGDIAPVQRFTASTGDAYSNAARLASSNAVISDASFLRFRNVSIAYSLPEGLIKRTGFNGCKILVQGQNVFTLTNYEGSDPENQNLYALSPLRTVILGIELSY